MLRKQLQRSFKLLSILLLFHITVMAQGQQSANCIITIDGHTISLFEKYNKLKESLLLAKDVENLDKSIWLYYYDGKIVTYDNYTFTPQLDFIIDTTTGNVIKHLISYNVTHRLDKGKLTMKSVVEILDIIQRKNLPFLPNLSIIKFDKKQAFTSSCGISYITVSKPAKLGAYQEELEINIKLYK